MGLGVCVCVGTSVEVGIGVKVDVGTGLEVGVTVAGSGVAVTTMISGSGEEQAKRRTIKTMAKRIKMPLRVQVANCQTRHLSLSGNTQGQNAPCISDEELG